MAHRKVLVVQIGKGVDLRGQDATKAASRAIRDAIGSNALPGLPSILEVMPGRLSILVKLGLPAGVGPVDEDAIKSLFPAGEIAVEVVSGGLLTPLHHEGANILIVLAVVEVAMIAS